MNKKLNNIVKKVMGQKSIECLSDIDILYLVRFLNYYAKNNKNDLNEFKMFLINNKLLIDLLEKNKQIIEDEKNLKESQIFYNNLYNNFNKEWKKYRNIINKAFSSNYKYNNILIQISIYDFYRNFDEKKDIKVICEINHTIKNYKDYYFKISFEDYYLNKHIFFNNQGMFKKYNNDSNYIYFKCNDEQLQFIEMNLNFTFRLINEYIKKCNTYYEPKRYNHKGKKHIKLSKKVNKEYKKSFKHEVEISKNFNEFLIKILDIDLNNIIEDLKIDLSYADNINLKNKITNRVFNELINTIKYSNIGNNNIDILTDYLIALKDNFLLSDNSYYEYNNYFKLKGMSYHNDNTNINNYCYDNNNLRVIK